MGELEAICEEAVEWRRAIHRNPEIGFEELATSDFVAKKLETFGIEVHRGLGRTGLVGTLRVGSGGRAIAFRADMDALGMQESNQFSHCSGIPGKMHACGDDGRTAMLLGAAKWLGAKRNFRGTLHFVFQPAEEHGRGAHAMLADGLLKRFPVEEIYGLHNAPGLRVGSFATRTGGLMASEDDFELRITGMGGHAARPNLVVDPIVAAGQIILALQTVVSRNVDPIDRAVVSITEIITDETRNVIPTKVVIKGDTRSFSHEVQRLIESSMRRIVEGICAANGCSCEFNYTHEFQPTINTQPATENALRAAREVFEVVEGNCNPVMIAEDFAKMLAACGNGNFSLIGNTPSGTEGSPNLHSSGYDFNDEALPFGVRYWIKLAEQRLSNDHEREP